jgi:hypothetical protein
MKGKKGKGKAKPAAKPAPKGNAMAAMMKGGKGKSGY